MYGKNGQRFFATLCRTFLSFFILTIECKSHRYGLGIIPVFLSIRLAPRAFIHSSLGIRLVVDNISS